MSCHRTPGNNLHLNIAQYVSGASPSDRRQIETLFHSLKNDARSKLRESAELSLSAPDLDPDARARLEWDGSEQPSLAAVTAHLDRIEFMVRNDPSIPESRRPKLLEYCSMARASAESGELPTPDTWYAWRNLTPTWARQRASNTSLAPSTEHLVAYDGSVVTEQDVLVAKAEYDYLSHPGHHFHGGSISSRRDAAHRLDSILRLFDTTDAGFAALEDGSPILEDYRMPAARRKQRATLKRESRQASKAFGPQHTPVSAPSGFSQSQIASAHNSYHVWRALCFEDAAMTTPAANRNERWQELEALAVDSDRRTGAGPALLRDRAQKRRKIRMAIDPTYPH